MKKTFLFCTLFLSLASITFADIVTLKSGKTWEGKITEQTDRLIKLDTGLGVPVTFWKDEIESVTEKPFDVKKYELPASPKAPKLVIIISQEEVEAVILKIQKAYQDKNYKALRELIADSATFVVGKNKEKVSPDDYIQMLQNAAKGLREHSYEIVIEKMKLDGPRAMTVETVNEKITTASGQKMESVGKQKNLYRKNKDKSIHLIYCDLGD